MMMTSYCESFDMTLPPLRWNRDLAWAIFQSSAGSFRASRGSSKRYLAEADPWSGAATSAIRRAARE